MTWEMVRLGACSGTSGLFSDGDWIESKDQDPKGSVRLIQMADIGVGFYKNKSARFLTEEKFNELKCTQLLAGDILISRMPDPIGRACIFPGDKKKCVTVVDIAVLRVDSSICDSEWLKYRINHIDVRAEITKKATGTTRKRISGKNLKDIQIPLPPLETQKQIVKLLDKAQSLIDKRKEQIALMDELIQSLFYDMFGDLSFPLVPLNNIAMKGRGTFGNGPFGSDLLSSELTDKGVPVIYIRDIRNGSFNRKKNICVTEEKAKTLSSCHIYKGDLLITKVGDPPGISAIYPNNELAIMTQDVIR